jgi:DNA-binding IclR family transcriptional regulator
MTCPCTIPQRGGYRPTRRNRQILRKYKAGKSIGFTMKSSLKAKGMLPRSNGRYILGPKYSKTGHSQILTRRVSRSRVV